MNYFGGAGILSGRASDGIGAAAPVKPRCLRQRRGCGGTTFSRRGAGEMTKFKLINHIYKYTIN